MSKVFKYKKYEGIVEFDWERNIWWGKILFIDDLVIFETVKPEHVQAEFESAVDDYVATCAKVGKSPQKPPSGLFNVRLPRDLHREAIILAGEKNCSLNEVIVMAVSQHLNGDQSSQPSLQINVINKSAEPFTVQTQPAGAPSWGAPVIVH